MLKWEQQNHDDDDAQPKHDTTARCGPQLALLVYNISGPLKQTQSSIAETHNVTATKGPVTLIMLWFMLLPVYFKIDAAANSVTHDLTHWLSVVAD